MPANRKRKLSTCEGKSKVFKRSSDEFRVINTMTSKECQQLGETFRVTNRATTSHYHPCHYDADEANDFNKDEFSEIMDEIESVHTSENGDLVEFDLENEIEDINEEWSESFDDKNMASSNHSSTRNSDLNQMISPASSPCGKIIRTEPKGSSWVKSLPEVSCNLKTIQENRELRKKRKFLKGGFAEQLERLAFQLQTDARNPAMKRQTPNPVVKIQIKDVYKTAGLTISHCSKVEDKHILLPSNNEQDLKLVVQNNIIKNFEVSSGSIVTVQPPWQSLKTSEEFHLIGPIIVNSDEHRKDSDQPDSNLG